MRPSAAAQLGLSLDERFVADALLRFRGDDWRKRRRDGALVPPRPKQEAEPAAWTTSLRSAGAI